MEDDDEFYPVNQMRVQDAADARQRRVVIVENNYVFPSAVQLAKWIGVQPTTIHGMLTAYPQRAAHGYHVAYALDDSPVTDVLPRIIEGPKQMANTIIHTDARVTYMYTDFKRLELNVEAFTTYLLGIAVARRASLRISRHPRGLVFRWRDAA